MSERKKKTTRLHSAPGGGTSMQGIKGTLHNRRRNNKPQHRRRNENHVPSPLGEGGS